MGIENKGKKATEFQKMCGVGFGGILISMLWIFQFSLLIYYRFSHVGKVCSGDFAIQEMADSA